METRSYEFRNYETAPDNVAKTYKQMHQHQDLSFVSQMHGVFAGKKGYRTIKGEKIRIPFEDVPAVLDKIVDESDPDTGLPQIYHAYQTGEALRGYLDPSDSSRLRKGIRIKDLFSDEEWQRLPLYYQARFSGNLHQLYSHIKDWSWLPLIGFLHDSGKVLADKQWGALPQWAVVGDTFPVGAPFSTANIYSDSGFYQHNPDLNIKANTLTRFGIYKKHCGLDQVKMSWGHDEYMYSVLHRTPTIFPDEALYIIRFHSFYPWHTPRNGVRGYTELAKHHDWMMLPLLKAFQKSDLYSKTTEMPDQETLQKYYMDLLHRYIPAQQESAAAKIKW
ncbi:MAG TPA: inositol oxygenase family protein [Gammaproteobacteria bacterium]|nr:inositol oxygenase family protein [Gammaproteobacteria bacterium]